MHWERNDILQIDSHVFHLWRFIHTSIKTIKYIFMSKNMQLKLVKWCVCVWLLLLLEHTLACICVLYVRVNMWLTTTYTCVSNSSCAFLCLSPMRNVYFLDAKFVEFCLFSVLTCLSFVSHSFVCVRCVRVLLFPLTLLKLVFYVFESLLRRHERTSHISHWIFHLFDPMILVCVCFCLPHAFTDALKWCCLGVFLFVRSFFPSIRHRSSKIHLNVFALKMHQANTHTHYTHTHTRPLKTKRMKTRNAKKCTQNYEEKRREKKMGKMKRINKIHQQSSNNTVTFCTQKKQKKYWRNVDMSVSVFYCDYVCTWYVPLLLLVLQNDISML